MMTTKHTVLTLLAGTFALSACAHGSGAASHSAADAAPITRDEVVAYSPK